jgi:hypothetical protein
LALTLSAGEYTALQRHFTENWKKMFPERKLRGLGRNFFIHMQKLSYLTTAFRCSPKHRLMAWFAKGYFNHFM